MSLLQEHKDLAEQLRKHFIPARPICCTEFGCDFLLLRARVLQESLHKVPIYDPIDKALLVPELSRSRVAGLDSSILTSSFLHEVDVEGLVHFVLKELE